MRDLISRVSIRALYRALYCPMVCLWFAYVGLDAYGVGHAYIPVAACVHCLWRHVARGAAHAACVLKKGRMGWSKKQ